MARQPTETQTILFDRHFWTAKKAREWLRKHKKVVGHLDEGPEFWHFRQLPPEIFKPKSLRTKHLEGVEGIQIVVGHLI